MNNTTYASYCMLHPYLGPFRIVYQSPPVTTVTSMVDPVQLVCIPSHYDDSLYTWEVVGGWKRTMSFLSSPVYVSHPGIFRCEVVNAVKGKAMSQLMDLNLVCLIFSY